MSIAQPDLFQAPAAGPPGLRYRRDLVSSQQEAELIAAIERLELRPFQMRGYTGHRLTASFGWRYDFDRSRLTRAEDIPAFLLPVRSRAAAFAGLADEDLNHALVIKYPPGAGIGWHRDRPQFAEVAGVSLGSACVIRFRRRRAAGWDRMNLLAEPRSAYVLTGPARSEWEHGIAAVEGLRYSITFRRLKAAPPA